MKLSAFGAVALLATAAFVGVARAYEPPEFFGGYAVVDDKVQELTPVKVELKSFSLNKTSVAAFTGLPKALPALLTFTPSLILYDQGVSVGAVHLSRLAPVPLGKTEADGFAWMITEDVPVKVKPLDQAGMFYFKPVDHLSSGYYALYGGQTLGAGVTSGSVFAFEVKHPHQDEIYGVLTRFIDAVRLQDWKSVASMSLTSANSGGSEVIVPVSEEAASSFKKAFFYTMGGAISAAGIREGTDAPVPGSAAYFCVDVNIYGALTTVTVNGKTLTGDSPRQMIVSQGEDGTYKVFTQGAHWVYTSCK